MLAWYRLGCRADALVVYRKGWLAMVAKLGLEPGLQLRHLHQLIPSDDPALHAAAAAPPAGGELSRGQGLRIRFSLLELDEEVTL